MKPARIHPHGASASPGRRLGVAFGSDRVRLQVAFAPVLTHCLVGRCASSGRFIQCGDETAAGNLATSWRKSLKKPSLNVGQDRRAATKWMSCCVRRRWIRHGGLIA